MIDKTEYMHSLVGTRYYIAPEVFMNDYRGVGYNKSATCGRSASSPTSC